MLFHSLEHIPRELVPSPSVEGHISKNVWATQIIVDGHKNKQRKNPKDSFGWVGKV